MFENVFIIFVKCVQELPWRNYIYVIFMFIFKKKETTKLARGLWVTVLREVTDAGLRVNL